MISLAKLVGFKPKFEVVGCYLLHRDRVLMLHRNPAKPQGDTWDTAGGKIHQSETPLDAIVREIKEETCIALNPSEVIYFKKFYVRYPEFDFIFHTFHHTFNKQPSVSVNPSEHTEYRWVTPKEALALKLIPDEDFCMKLFFRDCLQ